MMVEQIRDNRNPGIAVTNINPIMFLWLKNSWGPVASASPEALPEKSGLLEPAHLCIDKSQSINFG